MGWCTFLPPDEEPQMFSSSPLPPLSMLSSQATSFLEKREASDPFPGMLPMPPPQADIYLKGINLCLQTASAEWNALLSVLAARSPRTIY